MPENFTSGSFRGTRDELRLLMVRILRTAALTGWARAYGDYHGTIAEDTGAMKIGFNKAGRLVITTQRGTQEFRFARSEVYARWIQQVHYAEHHQEVGPTGLSYYKQPSRAGTKPFVWNDFKPFLTRHSRAALREQLQINGLEVRRNG